MQVSFSYLYLPRLEKKIKLKKKEKDEENVCRVQKFDKVLCHRFVRARSYLSVSSTHKAGTV